MRTSRFSAPASAGTSTPPNDRITFAVSTSQSERVELNTLAPKNEGFRKKIQQFPRRFTLFPIATVLCILQGTMKQIRKLIAFSCWAASLVWLSACQTSPAPSTRALAPEASVKPGINTEYLKPNLNVSNWVERFEKEGREIYDHREKIVAAAKIRPGSVVADIGSGTGLFTPMLSAATGPKGSVYAVDIVPAFLKLIAERAGQAGQHNVKTVLCTERSVELADNSIDSAFICDVYHHFEYPQHSLASLHRALRRNGEVFLIDFKRVPGVSSDWILNHVRAGQEVVTAEFEAAGFKKIEELPLLKDNYTLRFRKVSR